METLWIVIGISCIAVSVMLAAAVLRSRRKTVERLENMMEAAIDSRFTAKIFDETREASLENQMAQYLGAAETMKKELETERDKIRTLIADISHQSKTPIANIQLYSDLMKETPLSNEAEEYLNALKGQIDRLSFLIASLVKLSRLETGILSLHPHPCDVRQMIHQAADACREKAAEKCLTLQIEAEEAQAVFDEKWTEEALCNIIDNAVKYTDKGGITISVSVYEMFLSINIADTGIGIDESEIPKVFSRFYRGEEVQNREGVGIGLYLAREIITGENGYMKVKSEKGKGSVFSVYLPLSRKQEGF